MEMEGDMKNYNLLTIDVDNFIIEIEISNSICGKGRKIKI